MGFKISNKMRTIRKPSRKAQLLPAVPSGCQRLAFAGSGSGMPHANTRTLMILDSNCSHPSRLMAACHSGVEGARSKK